MRAKHSNAYIFNSKDYYILTKTILKDALTELLSFHSAFFLHPKAGMTFPLGD